MLVVLPAILVAGLQAAARAAEGQHLPLQQMVQATGRAAVTDGDVPAAERAAQKLASRKAVEQVLGVLVTAKTRVENSALIEERILTRAQGYAILKRTVSRSTEEDVCTFTGDFLVTPVLVADDAAKLGVPLDDVRVMVVIRGDAGSAAQTELMGQFTRARLAVVREEGLPELAGGTRDLEVVAAAGRKLGANIVVYGEAVCRRVGDVGEGVISWRAHIEAQVVVADTGQVIGADAREGADLDLSDTLAQRKALRVVAGRLAALFRNDIVVWALGRQQAHKLLVEVENVKSMADAGALQIAIGKTPGVNTVTRLDYKDGVLRLSVDVDADAAEAFATRIERAGVKVTAASQTSIRATRESATPPAP